MSLQKALKIISTLGVDYKQGKRTVDLNCPFCIGRQSGQQDTSYRAGVFGTLRFHCLRCKRNGSLFELLKAAAGVTWEKYKALSGGIVKDSERTLSERIRAKFATPDKCKLVVDEKIQFPEIMWEINSTTFSIYPRLKDFLRRRKINSRVARMYDAFYTGSVGGNSYRFGWPVYGGEGKIVGWQGRDITDKSEMRYKSHGPIGGHLYWSKYLEPPYRIYVVEGVLDCWRMESNAVATFTCNISSIQQKLLTLTTDLVKEVVFAWDGSMYRKSKQAARDLASIIPCGAIRLPDGEDPDSMGEKAIKELDIWWA